MRDKLEKNLKRCLKGRVKLSLATMIAFLLTGIVSYTAEEDTFLHINESFLTNRDFEDNIKNEETKEYINNSFLKGIIEDKEYTSALNSELEVLKFINNGNINYFNETLYSTKEPKERFLIQGKYNSFINNGTIISYNDKAHTIYASGFYRGDTYSTVSNAYIEVNSFINNGLVKVEEKIKVGSVPSGEGADIRLRSSNGLSFINSTKVENSGKIEGKILGISTKGNGGLTSKVYSANAGNGMQNDDDSVSSFLKIENNGLIKGQSFAIGGNESYKSVTFKYSGNALNSYSSTYEVENNGTLIGYVKGITENDTVLIEKSGTALRTEEINRNVTNKGIMTGSEVAINTELVTANINNYGIMAGQKIIGTGKNEYNDTTGHIYNSIQEVDTDKYKNYGIEVITEQKKDGDITTTEIKKVIVSNEKADLEDYTILNAQLIPSFSDLTYSLKFDDNSITEKYILNGIDKTLVVRTGETNTFKNSIINAFKGAIEMHNDSTLVLENSVVNGGADISSIWDKEKENFILNSTPVINITGDSTNLILKETLVNGDMKASGKDNFLTLENMYVYHNIDGFENMIINGNTTLNEEAEITGTDTITISKDGTLILSLKSTDEEVEGVKKATHSLNNGEEITIQGEGNGTDTAGTLKFITNGIGKEINVDMSNIELKNLYISTSSAIDKAELGEGYVILGAGTSLDEIFNKEEVTTPEIPSGNEGSKPTEINNYIELDSIYKGIYSSSDENLDMLRNIIGNTNLGGSYDENNNEEQLKVLMTYLNNIYSTTPYSYTSEASRNSMKLFSDVIEESNYKSKEKEVLVYGGLTHSQLDRGTELLGRNYHNFDTNSIGINEEIKTTGAYGLVEYGLNDTLSIGTILGGNKHNIDVEKSSSEGTSAYLGAYLKHDIDNVRNTLGIGVQYTEYDTIRDNLGYKYSGEYSDVSFNIYGQTKYSNELGKGFYIEPSLSLNYSYVMQEDIKEEKQPLSLNVKSKDFSVLEGTVGLDIRKEIVTEKARHNLVAGVGYTRILSGAEENSLTGDFGGSSFELLIPSKNEDSLSIGVKYQVERENGFIYDLKGSYNLTKDTENKEMRIGVGLGYKF